MIKVINSGRSDPGLEYMADVACKEDLRVALALAPVGFQSGSQDQCSNCSSDIDNECHLAVAPAGSEGTERQNRRTSVELQSRSSWPAVGSRALAAALLYNRWHMGQDA